MQKKKRPQGLSTHHPNGCKDTVSSLPDQKYSIKKHNLSPARLCPFPGICLVQTDIYVQKPRYPSMRAA